MSEVLTKLVIYPNGEQAILPLSTEELAQREIDLAAYAERVAAEEAAATALQALKDSARAKLAAGEPLSAEEAELMIP